jgi:hypothetical protein
MEMVKEKLKLIEVLEQRICDRIRQRLWGRD